MAQCGKCSAEIAEGVRYCPSCGEPASISAFARDLAQQRTVEVPHGPSGMPTAAPPQPDGGGGARFAPGQVLDGRYRIVAPLGQGGMGEVFRADDLRLGESVALKFLPPALASDAEAMRRLHDEVRIARQVTHPNVCRVYDLGEIDGEPFISMEFVDGEDLDSLIRRIGRFPGDKATEIARQLCAGVAAAHDKGVLHRDLKPANIMLDGRGQVRITDFGIAALSETAQQDDEIVGTPAYMAAEQLRGDTASTATDIYSLGLVLYELYTGRRAIEGSSLAEIQRAHETTSLTSPSRHVEDIDPVAEAAILRCVDEDPARRPQSVYSVMAELPGGDPLAAALAAGETPSPELVAAAGTGGMLPAPVAFGLFAWVLLGLIFVIIVDGSAKLPRVSSPEFGPQVLEDRGRRILARLGFDKAPADRQSWFFQSGHLLDQILKRDGSDDRWQRLADSFSSGGGLGYREANRLLVSTSTTGIVGRDHPPFGEHGDVDIELSTSGKLRRLRAVPPAYLDVPDEVVPFDWSVAFDAAGLDVASFNEVEGNYRPRQPFDSIAYWKGPHPSFADAEVHVIAASYAGRPTFFLAREYIQTPVREGSSTGAVWRDIGNGVHITCLIAALLVGALLARRNMKLGRSDPRSARKLSLYLFGLIMVAWTLRADHIGEVATAYSMFERACGPALFTAFLAWILYLSLEPTVRRVWPHKLTSWNRLLSGRFQDDAVRGEIIIGMAAGLTAAALLRGHYLLVGWLGAPPPEPLGVHDAFFLGAPDVVAKVLRVHQDAILISVMILFVFTLLKLALRKLPLSMLALGIIGIFGYQYPISSELVALDVVFRSLFVLVLIGVLLKKSCGLLALVAMLFSEQLCSLSPMSLDTGVWYAQGSLIPILVLVALGLYCARPALRKPVLPGTARA